MAHEAYKNSALVAYLAWMTTRRRVTCMGGSEDCAPAAESLKEFMTFNPVLSSNSITPVPTYFSPSSKWYEWEVNTIHLPIIRLKRWWASVR